MKSLWNAADRDALQSRFASLTDDRPALWGKMNCAAMVRHVTWAILMATGERPIPGRKTPLRLDRESEWLPHPAFGALTGEAWGRLAF